MRFVLLWILGVLAASATGAAAASASDFTFEQSPPYEGHALGYMPYRMYKAQGYDLPANSTRKYPLIIWLHGQGERGTNNTSQLTNGVIQLASDEHQAYDPAFIIAPQTDTATGSWGSETDPAGSIADHRLLLIIDDLKSRFRIDEDRIYVMGLSYGGSGTWNFATRHPDIVAAAAPMSQPSGGGALQLALLSGMPVWAFDGSNDRITAGTVNTARTVGVRANYTVITGGGHNSITWAGAASDPGFYRWLMAQRRLQPPSTSSLPFVRILEPSGNRGFVTGSASVPLSGTASLTETTFSAFSSIVWQSATGNGTASGTTSWTAGPVTVGSAPNHVRMIATALHDSDYTTSGSTTFSDSLMINDVTPPSLTVVNPTTGSTYYSPSDFLKIRGYASDDQFVSRVAWTNSRGGYGIAGAEINNVVEGQVNWTIHKLPLKPGHNIVTITAFDLAGNSVSRQLSIFRSPSRGGAFFAQDFDSSSNLSDYINTSLNPPANSFYDLAAAEGAGTLSIENGVLRMARSGTSTAVAGFLRRYAMEGPPTDVLAVSFDFRMNGNPSIFNTLATFRLGHFLGVSHSGGTGAAVGINQEVTIRGAGANKHRFSVSGTSGFSPDYDSDGVFRRVSWFVNSSTNTKSYLAPDGTTQELPGPTSDLWIDNVKVLSEVVPLSTHLSRSVRHFCFFSTVNQPVTFEIDNLVISDFSQESSYGSWLSENFSVEELADASLSGLSADLDGDGLSTLEEYALDQDPHVAGAAEIGFLPGDESTFQISFRRPAPASVSYMVEAADDLNAETWEVIATLPAGSGVWSGPAEVQESGTGDVRTVVVTDPNSMTGATARFVRLRIEYSGD